jgi:hypothetical protein
MPYGGDSDIGLIKLLNEVVMPQTNNAAYDLSTPAVEIITCRSPNANMFVSKIFFRFFRLRKKLGEKRKKKYRHLSDGINFSKSFYPPADGFIFLSYHLLKYISVFSI